jgi:hypothetical protein
MRFLSLLVVLLASSAVAQDTVIVSRRPVTVVQSSAQDAAVVLARRGALVHTGCGQTEGIGFSTLSADHAKRSCCYWGRRTPTDIGIAWSPLRRGWFAVVRYR